MRNKTFTGDFLPALLYSARMNSTHQFIYPPLSPMRLDKFLGEQLPNISRERLKTLIKEGCVTLNHAICTQPAQKTKPGDHIGLHLPAPTVLDVQPEHIPLDVFYEDDSLIVINKPAHLAVHPAGGATTGTLVNALLHHCRGQLSGIGGVERPGIVHRLDKGTSGLMVVAKTDQAHQHLAQQFHNRTIERLYWAVCYGCPAAKTGTIEGNIGRHPKDRKKMALLASGGKTAKTTYTVLQNFHNDAALVTCKLFTGRTHQIRVHMAHLHHSLIGDPVYGKPKKLTRFTIETQNFVHTLSHQMLHAKTLGFIHPETAEILTFESNIPHDMHTLITLLSAE